MFNNLSKQSQDFAIEFRKVPYALLIKKRNHGNSFKRRDLLACNSTRFICTNLGRIRSLDLMQMNLVHSIRSLDFMHSPRAFSANKSLLREFPRLFSIRSA